MDEANVSQIKRGKSIATRYETNTNIKIGFQLTFSVICGELFCLLGHIAAGKTVTVEMMTNGM